MIPISIFPWLCSYRAFVQYIKRRISIQEKGKIVRLNKNDGIRAIKECLSTINRNEIKSYWIVVMKKYSPRNLFEEYTVEIANLLKPSLFKS